MTNYTKSTDFAVKDVLLTGNPNKLVKGSEVDVEFSNMELADATNVKKTGTTGSAVMPTGTTAQRDASPAVGYTRVNTTSGTLEWWDGTIWTSANGGDAYDLEVTTATAGQTVITTASSFVVGSHTLMVYLNGLLVNKTSDYTETTTNSFTFNSGLTAGDDVVAQIWRTNIAVSGDALTVSYTPAGTGAIATTVQAKLRESVSVKDYGAVGDGVTDDTNAIKNAIAAVQSAIIGSTNILTTYSTPVVHFPKGVYVVSSALSADTNVALSFMKFSGEQSILKISAGVVAFGGIGPQVTFSNLQFHGGATALSVKTSNLDTAMILVENCQFFGQTTVCIKTDATSNSTLLTVKDSKFYTPTGAASQVLNAQTGDTITFSDCWVSCRNDTGAAFYAGATVLVLRNLFGVPITSLESWVDNYNVTIITESRFGGEFSGARAIVRNYATTTIPASAPTAVRIQNSHVYTTGNVLKLFAIPNQVIVRGNEGFINTQAMYVDNGVSATDLGRIGSGFSEFVIENNNNYAVNNYFDYTQGSAVALNGIPLNNRNARSQFGSVLSASDIALQIQPSTGGYGIAYANTATLTTPSDSYGVPSLHFVASAAGQVPNVSYTTALNGLSAGVYTVSFCVQVQTQDTMNLLFTAGPTSHAIALSYGKYVINIPIYFDGTNSKSVGWSSLMPLNAVLEFNRIIVTKGNNQLTDRRLQIEGTAAPVASQWYRGDRVTNTTPAVGSPKAWICTVSGAPGTWVSEGNL